MVEGLQHLFVPQLDGGAFRPVIVYASLVLSNYSDVILSDQNGTKSNGSNRRVPEIGQALFDWYRGRAVDQTPQFVGAGVWFLITIVGLVCALVVTTCRKRQHLRNDGGSGGAWGRLRTRLRSVRQLRLRGGGRAATYATSTSSSPSTTSLATADSLLPRSSHNRRRARLLTLRLLMLLVPLVVCSATLGVYWHYSGHGFGRMFQQQGARNSTGDGSLSGAVNSAVLQLNTFIEDTLVRTNSSVLEVCYEAFPSILDLFNRIAQRYLDLLSIDFELTPVLNIFDYFLGLVKLLLASMNSIKDSRDSVLSPLNSFTTVINRTREDIRAKVADVCATSPGNGVPVELCHAINEYLNQLTIGLDSRRIDSDSSVTIVTLLDKIFKLNVTQVEAQVNSAKSLLTNSLTLIENEITNLFNSLIDQVSEQFDKGLAGAEDLRSSMMNATQSSGFVEAFATGDSVLLSLSILIIVAYCLLLLFLIVLTSLLVKFAWHRWRWETARDKRQMGGDGPPAECTNMDNLKDQRQPQQPLRSLTSIVEETHNNRHTAKQQFEAKEIRHRRHLENSMGYMLTGPKTVVAFSLGLCFALTFLFGFALLYAGSEIQMDACRYMTTQSGSAVVDGMLDDMMDRDLWPFVKNALATKVSFPVPVTQAMLPKGLMRALLNDCANSSVTFFQIYNLVNAFNVTDLMQAKEVQTELYKGKAMVEEMIGGLNASTLIPAEVDNILAVLPDFARIIDTQDFSASIRELGKPLLTLGDRIILLMGDLLAVVRILLDRNPSDDRAILIRHFVDKLNSTYNVEYPALVRSLAQMRQHFVTLQTNRIVLNLTYDLTVSLDKMKLALVNRTALMHSVAVRYDQVLGAYMPEMVGLLNRLLAVILTRVGQCDGITSALGVVVGECGSSLASLPYGGFYVLLSSVLLVLLCIGAMPVLRAARRHKSSASVQLEGGGGGDAPGGTLGSWANGHAAPA